MAAISSAVEGLVAHDFDVAISGGIDRNMGVSTFIKFCKIGALSALFRLLAVAIPFLWRSLPWIAALKLFVAAFDAQKRATLCKCTHECNTRTMLLFDRANALPVLAAGAGSVAQLAPGRCAERLPVVLVTDGDLLNRASRGFGAQTHQVGRQPARRPMRRVASYTAQWRFVG